MGKLTIAGLILVILGVLGLASPYFTTTDTKEVATLGDFKLQATENTTHFIPPLAAGAVLVLGVLLVGVGYRKRM